MSDDKLTVIAQQLTDGEDPPDISARTLVNWFGKKRRGYAAVNRIRRSLEKHGLETIPDFDAVYIDSPIRFVLLPKNSDAVAIRPFDDPTYRIGQLPSANGGVISVKPNDNTLRAVTLMLEYDYSQLPVMQSEFEVKGVLSWTTLGKRLALGQSCETSQDCMEPVIYVRSDESLLSTVQRITDNEYVLVRNAENRVTGIVTTSDLSVQFSALAEPFLVIGEIENYVRRLLEAKFTLDEMAEVRDPDDPRPIESSADLTIGEYVRLLENEERWAKLGLPLERVAMMDGLRKARELRNDVMHFKPDPIEPEDLAFLKSFRKMMQELTKLGVI